MTESYEGRPLPRPHGEVVDQGLGFDLGTLHSRRRALRGLGLAAGFSSCSRAPVPTRAAPPGRQGG